MEVLAGRVGDCGAAIGDYGIAHIRCLHRFYAEVATVFDDQVVVQHTDYHRRVLIRSRGVICHRQHSCLVEHPDGDIQPLYFGAVGGLHRYLINVVRVVVGRVLVVRGGDEGQRACGRDAEIGFVVPGKGPSWAAAGGVGRHRICAVLGVSERRGAGHRRPVGHGDRNV